MLITFLKMVTWRHALNQTISNTAHPLDVRTIQYEISFECRIQFGHMP